MYYKLISIKRRRIESPKEKNITQSILDRLEALEGENKQLRTENGKLSARVGQLEETVRDALAPLTVALSQYSKKTQERLCHCSDFFMACFKTDMHSSTKASNKITLETIEEQSYVITLLSAIQDSLNPQEENKTSILDRFKTLLTNQSLWEKFGLNHNLCRALEINSYSGQEVNSVFSSEIENMKCRETMTKVILEILKSIRKDDFFDNQGKIPNTLYALRSTALFFSTQPLVFEFYVETFIKLISNLDKLLPDSDSEARKTDIIDSLFSPELMPKILFKLSYNETRVCVKALGPKGPHISREIKELIQTRMLDTSASQKPIPHLLLNSAVAVNPARLLEILPNVFCQLKKIYSTINAPCSVTSFIRFHAQFYVHSEEGKQEHQMYLNIFKELIDRSSDSSDLRNQFIECLKAQFPEEQRNDQYNGITLDDLFDASYYLTEPRSLEYGRTLFLEKPAQN